MLRQQDNLTTLGEGKLSFVDDYLAIEMVRFGDKLRFVKDIDPATLYLLVPSMLLQPIVENSIRHGLSTKVDGGGGAHSQPDREFWKSADPGGR